MHRSSEPEAQNQIYLYDKGNLFKLVLHKGRKQISGLQGLGKGEWGVTTNGFEVYFWDEETILESDNGDCCTML